MNIRILFLLFWALFSLHAQNSKPTPELARQLKLADKLMNEKSYYNAIEKYVQFDKALPGNEEVIFKLGLAYYITRDYKNGEKALTRYTSNKDYKKYPDAFFLLAEVLKSQGKYEDAIANYVKYTRSKSKSPEAKNYLKFAKNEISSCEWAKNMQDEDSTAHKASRLLGNMNRAYSDFSPFPVSEDTLIFASMQQDSILQFGHDDNHFHAVKLYETVKQDTSWTYPTELNEFNTSYSHTANGVVSPDGKYFYFTRCQPDRDNKIVCDIYFTTHDSDKIKQHKVKKVQGVNLGEFNTTQPSFQVVEKKDKKGKLTTNVTMYFSSDRPNGQGGRDIWYAQMIEPGVFKKPINCGNRINTPRDEVTPYYNNEEGQLLFSSNYHFGFGGQDIFKAIGKENKWQKPENLMFPLNSTFDDTYFVPFLKRSYEEEAGFIVSNRPGGVALHSETCCDDIYYFKEKLPEMITLKGKVSEWVVKTDTTLINDASKMLVSNSKTKIDSSLVIKDTIKTMVPVEKVFVGYIKKKVFEKQLKSNDTSYASLRELIVWQDTTDNSGAFNIKLRKNNDYVLVANKPSYNNKLKYFKASIDTVALTIDKSRVAKKDSAKKVVQVEKLTADLDINKIKDSEKFVLDNVYFDTDKDNIRKDALPALNILLSFLTKNPKVKVEISGHTDNHGTEEHNNDLSERRAESVVAWLVEKNIEEKRLVAKGYGESQPIAPNENSDGSDNPEGRALNRRTEIKVLSR